MRGFTNVSLLILLSVGVLVFGQIQEDPVDVEVKEGQDVESTSGEELIQGGDEGHNGSVVDENLVLSGDNSSTQQSSGDNETSNNATSTSKGASGGIVVKGRIKVACWDYRTMGVYNGSALEEPEGENVEVESASSGDDSVVTVGSGGDEIHAEDEVAEEVDSSTKPIEEQSATPPQNEEAQDQEQNIVANENEELAKPDVHVGNRTVEIANMTFLLHDVLHSNSAIKLRSTPSNCSVVLFYTTWCPFSAKAAPHFNALPRAYPPLRVAAIDSSKHKNINTYFGILSVPTLVLFHNGRIIAKFNESIFSLNKFAEFIEYYTDLKQEERMNVTTRDFEGPLPSVATKERDWYLVISWMFLLACFLHYVSKSSLWKKAVDFVRTTWNEAEAQHEHID